MSETFLNLFSVLSLFQIALLTGWIASIAGGVVGTYVVVKRIAFISGSIAHAVLSGIGLCLWLQRAKGICWVTPFQGALLSGILVALLMGWVHRRFRDREDSVIAAVWAVGMAVGVLFIAQTPGFNVELTHFLIGNILWVGPEDLLALALLDAIVLLTVFLFHKRFLALCFDEEQAELQGISVSRYYTLLLVLIACTTVLLIHVVGIILVITLLTIPATIANFYAKRLGHMMLLAVFIASCFTFAGTQISFLLNTPTGASIALISGAMYLLLLFFSPKRYGS